MDFSNDQYEELIQRIESHVSPNQDSADVYAQFQNVDVPSTIDHTVLAVTATQDDIDKLCGEALHYNFKAVCVRPVWVSYCREKLGNASSTEIACVVGFPEGTHTTEQKVSEARKAVVDGATELDMVLNYELLVSTSYEKAKDELYADVFAVRKAAPNVALKVIIETSQLSATQVDQACIVAIHAGANFVKTSTGFRGDGAKIEHVKRMRLVCDYLYDPDKERRRCQVKASGGIRLPKHAAEMLAAGANRLGVSAGVGIAEGWKSQQAASEDSVAPVALQADAAVAKKY